MFLTGRSLSKAIAKVLGGSNPRCAVAFLGQGCQTDIARNTKIICNLKMGGTNPDVVEELIASGVDVRQSDTLHAKVYISDNGAIVSSANFSINGLGLEKREQSGWIEAGYIVPNSSEIRAWFDNLGSRKISSADIERARRIWRRRQKPALPSLKNLEPLVARNHWVCWWRDAESLQLDKNEIEKQIGVGYDTPIARGKWFAVGRDERDSHIVDRHILMVKFDKSGRKYGRAISMHWVYASKKVIDGAEVDGELSNIWIDEPNPRPSPFRLTPNAKALLLNVINSPKYKVLRELDWVPWFTEKREQLVEEFWHEIAAQSSVK